MPSTHRLPRRRFLATCAATATALGSAGCLGSLTGDGAGADGRQRTDWPTAGHDRTNGNATGGNAPTDGVDELWRADVGTVTAQPVVVDGVAYVVAGDLLAFDAEGGERRWSVSAADGQGRFWAAPTVRDGTVYLANGHRRVHALDAESGETRWTTEIDVGSYVTPRLDPDGEALFVGGAGHVSRLDPETGAVEWRHDLFGQVRQPLAYRRSTLYAVTEGGELYALDEYGDGYWRVDLPAKSGCPPTVHERRVYVGAFDGRLHAIDTSRASVAWSTEIGGFATGGIAVDGERVYADGGRALHALDTTSGDRQWSFDVGATGDHVPVVAGDTVYTTGDRLYALKPGGGFTNGAIRQDLVRFSHATGGYAGPMSAAAGRLFVAARLDDDAEGNQSTALVVLG